MREFVDFNGVKVVLSDDAIEHILDRHPEMGDYLELIGAVLANPVAVTDDPRPNRSRLYGLAPGRQDKYLRIAVKYLPDEAYVTTAFFTYRIE